LSAKKNYVISSDTCLQKTINVSVGLQSWEAIRFTFFWASALELGGKSICSQLLTKRL